MAALTTFGELSEKIILPPLATLMPGSLYTEAIVTNLSINFSPTGGTFSLSTMKDSVVLPQENVLISLPFGRIGIVKQVGTSQSSGGLIDTVSGPILPLAATLQTFYGLNTNQVGFLAALANLVANGASVSWETTSYPYKNFIFRGIALSGIQQVASVLLAEVIVRTDGVHVVDPGAIVKGSTPFSVPQSDIVSVSQTIDFSQDIRAVLNPALTAGQIFNEGDFVYDSDHAQKQPQFTVQAGAPQSKAGTDFIQIPDGWMIDGNFEDWTPANAADLTNPSTTAINGRYWKVFRSPADPTKLRGIINFTRLVKELKLPGNVSTFVGSPVTAITNLAGSPYDFKFDADSTNNGIYGFESTETTLFDAVSGKFVDLVNALVLRPRFGVDTGGAAGNFLSITMEMWTFPRVNPVVLTGAGSANPFNLPKDVVIVSPNGNVVGGGTNGYWSKYLANYRLINSPRLKTNVSVPYRGSYVPQVGDPLSVVGIKYPNCGRISGVSLNFGRSGMVVSITAEKYQFTGGLWNGGGGGTTFSG